MQKIKVKITNSNMEHQGIEYHERRIIPDNCPAFWPGEHLCQRIHGISFSIATHNCVCLAREESNHVFCDFDDFTKGGRYDR